MSTWVTTDLHGNYNLWTQIKNFIKEDDILFFLGDAIDRGPRGFEIFKEMLEDKRVIYLRGNHEQMMYDSFIIQPVSIRQKCFKHWQKNGGDVTLQNIEELNIPINQKINLIEQIEKLPYFAEYKNNSGVKFFLSHAGTSFGLYYNKFSEEIQKEKLLWDRDHILMPWGDEAEYQMTISIHGHTPILFMKQFYGYSMATGMAPFVYSNNHKINLDAATPFTNMAFLYNLDTLKYEFFIQNNLEEDI